MQRFHNLAAPPQLSSLGQDNPIALFVDFDGTLIDIAPTPDSIAVPDELARVLGGLAERLQGRFALVSGRSLEDLRSHLGSLDFACAGSHGGDCLDAQGRQVGSAPRDLPAALATQVQSFADRNDGVEYERKSHGAALHFRARPELQDRVWDTARSLAEEHSLTLKRGKCVVELITGDADKGDAVHSLMRTDPFIGARPIFVGDDVTDEDGFAAAIELGGVAVAVGERVSPQAHYRLASPAAVRDWLGL